MKSEILSLLKQNRPAYVSGEDISNTLQVSRTAIWKHIGALREDGYVVDSLPRVGYRLVAVPDCLFPEELSPRLQTKIIGTSIVHYQTTTSTNDMAKELAIAGMPEGTIVVAEEQTGGRGRLGRVWQSPAGLGIWLSLILRPEINPMDAPKLTLLAAVALARTMSSYPNVCPGIKWPNDILVEGKKIAGVLTEMNAEMDRVNFIVLGIGININTQVTDLPEELREIATSLYIVNRKKWGRVEFAANMLRELEELYLVFLKGDFAAILEEWKSFSVTLGHKVKVVSPRGENLVGVARDLDGDGAMILETSVGVKKIVSGEVLFE